LSELRKDGNAGSFDRLPPFFKFMALFIGACVATVIALLAFFAVIFVALVGWEALPWS
jgi:hypothetical protein